MAATKAVRAYTVRHSPIHGRGVFAARNIRKGAEIIEYRGERISWDKALKRPDTDPDNPFHTFFFSLDDGRVIDASVRGNAARWINHSCAPNCESQEDDDGRVFIEAKRPIAKGEELTYDYRLTIDGRLTKAEREWFTCRCGAARCRGTMLAKKPSASGPKKQGSAKKAKKAGKSTDAGKTAKATKAKKATNTRKAKKTGRNASATRATKARKAAKAPKTKTKKAGSRK